MATVDAGHQDLAQLLGGVVSPMVKEVDDEDIELLCTCRICHEIMEDPLSLHCKHSYCKDCIEELVAFGDDDEPIIKCPECRFNTVLVTGETVSSLKRHSTLETLMKRLELLSNDRLFQESVVEDLQTCCEKPKSWYCWGCKYYFCTECIDHVASTETCKELYPLRLKYSRRFQSYVPYCGSHHAFHTNGCLLCADTFCHYCGVTKHKGHQVTSFTEYTYKFKNPIDTKIRGLKTYIAKLKDILEQTKISNYNIQIEKDMIDKFLQQKKIILLSQILLMLEVAEAPMLQHCGDNQISFGEVKKDIEIGVDNELFHAILNGFDDVRIGGLDNKSITRSVSMLNDKIHLSPLLFPNLINHSEAEKYVHEALEKMNLYTRNKMVCLLSFQTSSDDDENLHKFAHEKMMIVLSALFALELCEKKIIKKFYNAWKEFKGVLTDFKDKINENFTTAKKILKQFENLTERNAIDVISQAKDLLDEYYSVLHPKIIDKQTRVPEFVVRIEAEESVNRISDLLDRDYISATLESFCNSLQLNVDVVLSRIHEMVRDSGEGNELIYLFWNRDDCEGAEKYVHQRLKDIGLHNSNIPDFAICKEDVITLVDKGFPLNASINAVYFTNNEGVETAMKWIFEHSKDADFNMPLILDYPLKEDLIKPSDTAKLTNMGFSELDARIALTKTGSVEDAATWICIHKEKANPCNEEDEEEDEDPFVCNVSALSNLNEGENDDVSATIESGCGSRRRSSRRSKKEKWQRKVHESSPEIVMLYYLSNLTIANKKIVPETENGLKTNADDG